MKKLMALVLALGLVMGFASLASAGVTVGGDLRLETTIGFHDDDYSNTNFGINKSYANWDSFNNSTSRLKFRWKSGNYGAYVEIGTYGNWAGSNVATRRTEFWYNWDGGQIWFGQGYHLSEHYWPNQYLLGALSLIGYGKHYLGRTEQIKLTLGKKHKLVLGLYSPKKSSVWTGGRAYHNLPAAAAAVHLNFGNVRLTPWINYELVQWENANTSDTYNSLDFGLRLAGDFGLVGFSVAVSYGINSSQSSAVSSTPLTNAAGTDVTDDATQFNVWGELRIGGLSLGGGYVIGDRTDFANQPYRFGAYASYKIPFGPITFRPEIVYLDDGETSAAAKTDNGSTVYAGLFTNIAF